MKIKLQRKKNVVLPNDAENIIDRTRKKSYEKKISQNISKTTETRQGIGLSTWLV